MTVLTNPSNWQLGVPFVVCVVLTLLYAQGGRSHRRDRRRAAAFYGGIATIVLALDTPVDAYADAYFSVHMLQHVLLITVAPPLLVVGRPWPRLWQPLPVSVRRGGARLISLVAPFTHPAVALGVMTATLAAWHVPALYDATLRSNVIHQLEHLSFVVTAIAFWAGTLGAPPLRARLEGGRRILYFVLALVPGWILGIVLAFARTPIYSYAPRHGGITALADQQIAAGVMWVPGSIVYIVAACWSLYAFLERGSSWSSPATSKAGS